MGDAKLSGRSAVDRFLALVARDSSGCWPWQGARSSDVEGRPTYGSFNAGRWRGQVAAHVFAWELANPGVDRDGQVVRHTCDNPACVNPRHLVIGTHAQNTADMDARGRRVSNPVRGEQHHNARMTDEQVAEARALYDVKRGSTRQLASRYGVSSTTMWAILRRGQRS